MKHGGSRLGAAIMLCIAMAAAQLPVTALAGSAPDASGPVARANSALAEAVISASKRSDGSLSSTLDIAQFALDARAALVSELRHDVGAQIDAQTNNLMILRELDRVLQEPDASSFSTAVELAKTATSGELAAAPTGSPEAEAAAAPLPSVGALSLLRRNGFTPTASERADLRSLDRLEPPLRDALGQVIAAFVRFDAASDDVLSSVDLSSGKHKGPKSHGSIDQSSADTRLDLVSVMVARIDMLEAAAVLQEAYASRSMPAVPVAPVFYRPVLHVDLGERADKYGYDNDFALLIDGGGDDTYHNNSGGSNIGAPMIYTDGQCSVPAPLPPNQTTALRALRAAALIDLDGEDRYIPTYSNPSRGSWPEVPDGHDRPEDCGVNGGGAYGSGFLLDAGGDDDRYIAGKGGVNGGGRTGAGLLLDDGGNDTYVAAGDGANGGANLGSGLLVDHHPVSTAAEEGRDTYTTGDTAGNGGSRGHGRGFLIDTAGNDTYSAGGSGTNGGASGILPGSGGSASGILFDYRGDDTYAGSDAGVNGGASAETVELLAQPEGQVHPATTALLVDGEGQDRYTAAGRGTNGGGHSGGMGLLLDHSTPGLPADDVYRAASSGANGGASGEGVGLLLDVAGADRYAAGDRGTNGGAFSPSSPVTRRGFAGAGWLADLEGSDAFRAGATGTNGGVYGFSGVALLLDAGGTDSYAAGAGATNGGSATPTPLPAFPPIAVPSPLPTAVPSPLPGVLPTPATAVLPAPPIGALLLDAGARGEADLGDRYEDPAVPGLAALDCTIRPTPSASQPSFVGKGPGGAQIDSSRDHCPDRIPTAPALASAPGSPTRQTDPAPLLVAKAQPGTKVTFYDNPHCEGTGWKGPYPEDDGQVRLEFQATPNSTSEFSAVSTDHDGDESLCSPPLVYRQDSKAPAVTIKVGPREIEDPSSTESIALTTTTPVFSGTASEGDGDANKILISLYEKTDGGFVPRAVYPVRAVGSWSHAVDCVIDDTNTCVSELVAGKSYRAEVTQKDSVGNVGSGQIEFTVNEGAVNTHSKSRPRITAISPAEGTIGDTVTISGSDLNSVRAIEFDDYLVDVRSKTYDSLTLDAPSLPPGGVTVTAQVSGEHYWDDYAVGALSFTLTDPKPLPTITEVAPSSGPTSGGTEVTITGTRLTGGPEPAPASAPHVFFGASVGQTISASPTKIVALTPATNEEGVVEVTVVTHEGTSLVVPAARFRFVQPLGELPPPISHVITTFAGSDGLEPGPATKVAQRPSAVAVEQIGGDFVTYVGDDRFGVVRMVDEFGDATVVAGGGSPLKGIGDGGPPREARLSFPAALAVDASSGNLYIADSNRRVRIVFPGPDGVVNGGDRETIETLVPRHLVSYHPQSPAGLAIGVNGELYISDAGNKAVYKMTPGGDGAVNGGADEGTVPVAGVDGGDKACTPWTCTKPADAVLTKPTGLAVDRHTGDLYVADTGGRRVIKIFAGSNRSADGDDPRVVVAGRGNVPPSPVPGTPDDLRDLQTRDGNPATSVYLHAPEGLVFDPASGDLYIADSGDGRVRKVEAGENGLQGEPSEKITTVAGGGSPPDELGDGNLATEAKLIAPVAVAIKPARPGSKMALLIADRSGLRLRSVSADAEGSLIISTVAGTGTLSGGDERSALAATLGRPFSMSEVAAGPTDVTLDAGGNAYIADTESHLIRRVDSSGTIWTVAGVGIRGYVDGSASEARLDTPVGIAVDSSGNIYFADSGNRRIRRIAAGPDGVVTGPTGQSCRDHNAGGESPCGTGEIISTLASGPDSPFTFMAPSDVAVDGSTGDIYVVDTANHKVLRIHRVIEGGSEQWRMTNFAGIGTAGYGGDGGSATASGAKLDHPNGLALDGWGNVYIADSGNKRIRRVSPDGKINTVGGGGTLVRSGAAATAATLARPAGVTVAADGSLYITAANHTIQKIAAGPDRVVTGPTGQSCSDNHAGANTHVAFPCGDGETLTVVAGEAASQGFAGDGGAAVDALLAHPAGIGADAGGTVYFADSANYRVRMLAGTASGAADLGIEVVGGVVAGKTTYSVTVANHGPDLDSDVRLLHRFPPGVGYHSAIPSQGSCDPLDNRALLVCRLGMLRGGQQASVEVKLDTREMEPSVGPVELVASGSQLRDPDLANNNTLFVIPPASFAGKWQYTGALGLPRVFQTATLLDPPSCHDGTASPDYPCGKVLIAGGLSVKKTASGSNGFSSERSAEVYDPATGEFTATGEMVEARYRHTATLLENGDVLVVGGIRDGAALASAEVFAPTVTGQDVENSTVQGSWRRVAGMKEPRVGHVATRLDGPACTTGATPAYCADVLIVGGVAESPQRFRCRTGDWPSSCGHPISRIEIYDAEEEEWRPGLPMNACVPQSASCTARSMPTMTSLPDGRLLVAGGVGPSENDERLTESGTGGSPSGSPNCQLQGQVGRELLQPCLEYIQRTAQIYDPAANKDAGGWSPTGSMALERVGHTATVLSGEACGSACGRVVVAGGGWPRPSRLTLAASELYDPLEGRWKAVPAASSSRRDHSGTPLDDGSVLMAGGAGGSDGTAGDAVELFACSSVCDYRWTASLGNAREAHTATRLDGPGCRAAGSSPSYCGGVLLTGGYGASPGRQEPAPILSSAELYIPVPTVASLSPSAGSADESARVRIVGTGFRADSEVYFGEQKTEPADISLVSSREIIATAPAQGARTIEVIVTNSAGRSFPSPGSRFTYLGPGPGPVEILRADAAERAVSLVFKAASSNGSDDIAPPATEYVIKQSRSAITEANFDTASSLCDGICTFEPPPSKVGDQMTLDVKGLSPHTTYYFAIKAKARNVLGPMATIAVKTLGDDLLPGRVDDLSASAISHRKIRLIFSAPGEDGSEGAPVRDFVIKQSKEPITESNFGSAKSLCESACSFSPSSVGDDLSLEVKDLAADTTYDYALKAIDEGGNVGSMSNVASATTEPDTIAPSAVNDLEATPLSGAEVKLTFSAVASDDTEGPPVSDYVIKQSRAPITDATFEDAKILCDGDCRFSPAAVGDKLALSVTRLQSSTTYHYALKAVDEGDNTSALSNIASATTTSVTPGTVKDLSADPKSMSRIELSFGAADDGTGEAATSYLIKQSRKPIGDEDDFSDAKTLCGEFCRFDADDIGERLRLAVTGLQPGTTYHYAIRALDDSGKNFGARSHSVKAKTLPDLIPPGRVNDLRARPLSSSVMKLLFSAVASNRDRGPAVTTYIIKQSTRPIRGAGSFKRAQTLCSKVCSFGPGEAGARLSLKVADLSPDTTYYYSMRAVDAGGNKGAWSKVAKSKTSRN